MIFFQSSNFIFIMFMSLSYDKWERKLQENKEYRENFPSYIQPWEEKKLVLILMDLSSKGKFSDGNFTN
jgi:hypothetical protein